MVLYFVPIVGIVIHFIVSIGVADMFKKGAGYGVGLALLPVIFYPMLAFGDAQYG